LYCSLDALWQRFKPPWERELLGSGKRRRLSRWRYRIDTIVDLLVKRTHLKRVEAHDL
jgi:hypothetical protein